jgi:type I restriction enzyme S subunit
VSWGLVKLGDIAPSKPLKKPEIIDENNTWQLNLDMVESQSGRIIKKQKGNISEAGTSTHWFDSRHVLYSKLRPYLNKVVLPDEQGLATTELVPMLPDEERLDRNYLMHYLRSNHFVTWITEQVAGAKMPRVSMTVFWSHKIPLPYVDKPAQSLLEQKRIAAILDKADAIRHKRQQAIKLAEDFLRSVFLDMFGDPITNPKGWEIRSLSTLCNKITDGTHHSPPIVEKGVPYITAKHLKKTGLEFFAKPWYISEESHQNIYSRCNPEINDVLYIKDGATTGLAAINEYDFEFSMLSSLALLKPDYEKITSEFLCVFLNHPRTKLVLTANMAGAAITRLTLSKIKVVKVPLPDLDSQKKFTQVYTNVKALVTKVKISSEQASENFNSLSQKAFAGEL